MCVGSVRCSSGLQSDSAWNQCIVPLACSQIVAGAEMSEEYELTAFCCLGENNVYKSAPVTAATADRRSQWGRGVDW